MPTQHKPGGKQQPKREHDVHVRGTITTDHSPDEKKRHSSEREEDTTTHRTEREEDRRRESQKMWLEGLTLFAVAVYAGLTAWQGSMTRQLVVTAQNTFAASERPYVGMKTITPSPSFAPRKDKKPSTIEDATGMSIQVEIQNFGPVPASNFSASWKLFDNGIAQQLTKVQDSPDTLYPTEIATLNASVGRQKTIDLLNGRDILEVEITIIYDGSSGHYYECSKHRYTADVNRFSSLGKCTGQ